MDKSIIGITERGDAALDPAWTDWVEQGRPAILISKDPMRLYLRLTSHVVNPVPNIIVHATITGFGGTQLEPNVPKAAGALKGYENLIELLGVKRVVLRVDPIIPSVFGAQTAEEIANQAKGRVRISFIDQYPHVKERLFDAHMSLEWESFHAPLGLRKKIWEDMGRPEICGEPGFECTGCVSKLDCETLGVLPGEIDGKQRQYCACLTNKKELLKSRAQCAHRCLYCYWR